MVTVSFTSHLLGAKLYLASGSESILQVLLVLTYSNDAAGGAVGAVDAAPKSEASVLGIVEMEARFVAFPLTQGENGRSQSAGHARCQLPFSYCERSLLVRDRENRDIRLRRGRDAVSVNMPAHCTRHATSSSTNSSALCFCLFCGTSRALVRCLDD